jgi:hypothetical protein
MRSSMISARSVTTSKDNIRTGNKELPCAVRGSEGATLGSPTAGLPTSRCQVWGSDGSTDYKQAFRLW